VGTAAQPARQAACALHRVGGNKEASMTHARSWLRQLLIPILMVATLVGTVRVAEARCDGSDGTYQTCIREEGACLDSWRSWTCGGFSGWDCSSCTAPPGLNTGSATPMPLSVAPGAMWNTIQQTPGAVWNGIVQIPNMINSCGQWLGNQIANGIGTITGNGMQGDGTGSGSACVGTVMVIGSVICTGVAIAGTGGAAVPACISLAIAGIGMSTADCVNNCLGITTNATEQGCQQACAGALGNGALTLGTMGVAYSGVTRPVTGPVVDFLNTPIPGTGSIPGVTPFFYPAGSPNEWTLTQHELPQPTRPAPPHESITDPDFVAWLNESPVNSANWTSNILAVESTAGTAYNPVYQVTPPGGTPQNVYLVWQDVHGGFLSVWHPSGVRPSGSTGVWGGSSQYQQQLLQQGYTTMPPGCPNAGVPVTNASARSCLQQMACQQGSCPSGFDPGPPNLPPPPPPPPGMPFEPGPAPALPPPPPPPAPPPPTGTGSGSGTGGGSGSGW